MFIEDRAYHAQKKLGRQIGWIYALWIAALLIFLLIMLPACSTTQPPLPANVPLTKTIYEPVYVPNELLQLNEVYGVITPPPQTESVCNQSLMMLEQTSDLALESLGALELCNADKLKIKEWNDVKAD